ncbi:MAG: hypothetical protein AAB614_00525 [Patescibacteria group bacterium]
MRKLLYLFLFVIFLYPQAMLYAAPPDTSGLGSIAPGQIVGSQSPALNVEDVLLGLVNWLAWLVALAAVVAGLYSGFLFITSGDDEKKLGKATKFFVYTIVGVIVAILAFSIVAIAKSIVGI